MARIYLSPPDVGPLEREFLLRAFDSNWIAPLGPAVDAFEAELAAVVEAGHAVALSSGTAALHLALRLAGVAAGDEVFLPTLTFVATANPVRYLGAEPVFIDSEAESWNLDPGILQEVLERRADQGRLPAAVIAVHLYGQTADMNPIIAVCERYGVPLVEDAAEALGADYKGRAPGVFGQSGVYSFNGNKIITTSGGGMLVTDDGDLASMARKLASQARDPAPHYQHSELGYNYRLSNLLAAIGRAQLQTLEERVRARRAIFERYKAELDDVPGFEMQPEAPWGRHSRWLTCLLIDPTAAGVSRDEVRIALEREDIEARPLWKPLHLQPLYQQCTIHNTGVAEALFRRGLCLPSGSNLSSSEQERVIGIIKGLLAKSGR